MILQIIVVVLFIAAAAFPVLLLVEFGSDDQESGALDSAADAVPSADE